MLQTEAGQWAIPVTHHRPRNGNRTTEILSRWMVRAHAECLVVGFYAAITAMVFLVLGMHLAVQ